MQPRHHHQGQRGLGRLERPLKTFFSTLLSLFQTERWMPQAQESNHWGCVTPESWPFFGSLVGMAPSSHPRPNGRPQLVGPGFVPFYWFQFRPPGNVFIEGKMNICSLGFFSLHNSATESAGQGKLQQYPLARPVHVLQPWSFLKNCLYFSLIPLPHT